MRAWKPKEYTTADRNDRPVLLNRYHTVKLQTGIPKAVPVLLSASGANPNDQSERSMKKARHSFTERITWLEPLRGSIPQTEKEKADNA